MGMAHRVGKAFDEGELALEPERMGNGCRLKLVKPGQHRLQLCGVGAGLNFAGLLITQSVRQGAKSF